MSDPDSVRELLGSAGFTEVGVRELTAPMYYDSAAWLVTARRAS